METKLPYGENLKTQIFFSLFFWFVALFYADQFFPTRLNRLNEGKKNKLSLLRKREQN